MDPLSEETQPQAYYDAIKQRFAEEREIRLNYRPEGAAQYDTELQGVLAKYDDDPHGGEIIAREALTDTVECLFIGGGFSALLTSARLREIGVDSIRIVERGADVGGTWYWNRYPGIACDVPSYDYLPLLDEMDYVPKHRYARGEEIYEHCQAIAKKYDLYKLAVFQTTVTATVWNKEEQLWHIKTNRGDHMKARFVICANGILSKPKLTKIKGMQTFKGHTFHTSRWDYDYTGDDLSKLKDKRVGIIGTGATAVQAVPGLGANAKELFVFQRTPSSIDVRDDWETDKKWAHSLPADWQAKRREISLRPPQLSAEGLAKIKAMPREEKLRRQENANMDAMMRIHQRIEEIVTDKDTAEALKPWYMMMCKRPCFHEDYLPTFNRPSVHLVDTKGKGVTEITEKGVIVDGKEYELDLLIFATGFEIQKTGIYNEIIGDNGVELNDKYADGIRTLLGIHSKGYPNLFIMNGYQASFQFNLTDMMQSQGGHIAACIDYARKHDYQSLDVTEESEEFWVQEVIKFRGKTDRNKQCTPGYYNFEGADNRRQDGTYNGGFVKYMAEMTDIETNLEKHFKFSK
ncbi:MAG: NAD(P)/FAD-dependent oxidoreductase [Gammaproteobacteria bacterium]|nr:NAD(P)/FAD-dependent oxidoreductase [Gammaproteobacteria bacterium]MBQ0839585.1 NAD(P)/FAD-dependent oxidoreductase [Gammaproteobacteria bacterium]